MEDLDHSFEPSTIQRMEMMVLNALGWRLASTTAYSYLELLEWILDSLKPQLHEKLIGRLNKLLLGAISGIYVYACTFFIRNYSMHVVQL